MRMTLIEGDRILVSKLQYGPLIPLTKTRIPGFSKPKRGDVIVFKSPVDPTKDFIKRLIALGGETVEIRDGKIFINDQVVDHPVINKNYYYNRDKYGGPGQKITVPENYYYVLGDNSGNSQDSRYWGFVPKESVIGQAELLYWPLNRIRFIK